MIRLAIEHWTAANESTTADATMEDILVCAEKLASIGPFLVRFVANRGGFAVLRGFRKTSNSLSPFDGVLIFESDDYHETNTPARIVAVFRDSLTGTETEKVVYGAVA